MGQDITRVGSGKNLDIDGFRCAKPQSPQTEGEIRHQAHLLTAA